MIRPFLDLPAFRRQRLLAALETGGLAPPYPEVAVRVALGMDAPDVQTLFRRWAELGVTAPIAASWLRSVESLDQSAVPAAEFVWSGPIVRGLHALRTGATLETAIGSADKSVWLSTYVFFDGPRAFEALARRMEERPELMVRLLLNIERKRGDTTRSEALVRRFAGRFWGKDWPGSRLPEVFYDPRSLDLSGPEGVLHAKALVVDDEIAFVSSANLTEAALERNIEMGVLVRDRILARTVVTHFRGLIERGNLEELPPA